MVTFRAFLAIAMPYWGNRAHWREWLLLAAATACSLAFVQVIVAINAWYKTFYDALAVFDAAAMPALMLRYCGYLALIVCFIAFGNWLGKVVVFRWRESLTKEMQRLWLANRNHYRLKFRDEPDNPDQRIAEDIGRLAEDSVYLFKYFIMNIARSGAFIAILWELSGVRVLVIAGSEYRIYGYLVWIALVWSALSTAIIHLIGHRLQPLNIERQRCEADYRASLMTVRDNSEQIALYNGEKAENHRLDGYFSSLRQNLYALIGREFRVECFSSAQMRISWFIPIVATLPLYLNKTISLGDMMQGQSAFSNVLDGFGWFLNYYRRIIEWSATVQRVARFRTTLESLPCKSSETRHSDTKTRLVACQLVIHDPSGNPIAVCENMEFSTPRQILIDGASGVGKSTFIRILTGLWPFYTGSFSAEGTVLCLPQRPYLPHDTLRHVLTYPCKLPVDDIRIIRCLEEVGMKHLCARLDEKQEWQKTLSGGEQQRLAVSQALLYKPDILFADEVTNQLDVASAIKLVRLLKAELPSSLIMLVSHQPEVRALFHDRIALHALSEKQGKPSAA